MGFSGGKNSQKIVVNIQNSTLLAYLQGVQGQKINEIKGSCLQVIGIVDFFQQRLIKHRFLAALGAFQGVKFQKFAKIDLKRGS